jgi:RNA polymerase sigma-70 factor (ECF subfamily)
MPEDAEVMGGSVRFTSGESPDAGKGFAAPGRRSSIRALRRRGETGAGATRAFRLTRAEERRLLDAARSGDRRALRRLIDLLSGPIYRFGRGFCGDSHDAEDVTQVVLMALARTLKDFRGEASIVTWAYTVARRACSRQRRRSAGAPARIESIEAPAGGGDSLEMADALQDPHRDLERTELRRALERAIASLPQAQREVVVLRDVEGLPAREVGSILGLGERAVKSRLHRARVALRDTLAPWMEGGADDAVRPSAVRETSRARCPDTARLISRYLEGELDASACGRLEAHLATCPSCGTACETLRRALTACSRWRAEQLPPAAKEALRQALREAVAVVRVRSASGG